MVMSEIQQIRQGANTYTHNTHRTAAAPHDDDAPELQPAGGIPRPAIDAFAPASHAQAPVEPPPPYSRPAPPSPPKRLRRHAPPQQQQQQQQEENERPHRNPAPEYGADPELAASGGGGAKETFIADVIDFVSSLSLMEPYQLRRALNTSIDDIFSLSVCTYPPTPLPTYASPPPGNPPRAMTHCRVCACVSMHTRCLKKGLARRSRCNGSRPRTGTSLQRM